jgi:hypothetical protein
LVQKCCSTINLGLKFIPKPSDISNIELYNEFLEAKRKSKWSLAFYLDGETNDDFNPRLKIPSTSNHSVVPNLGFYEELYTDWENNLHHLVNRFPPRASKSKLDKQIQNDINLLKSTPNLVIVDSDKNLGIVTLDLQTYHDLVMKHLNDKDTYEQVAELQSTSNSVLLDLETKLWNKHSKSNPNFDEQTKAFLFASIKVRNRTIPYFGVLPKVHKGLATLSSRPIVRAWNCHTTASSIVLDIHLQHHFKIGTFGDVSHIIKDSKHLADKLDRIDEIKPDATLVSFDVVSLYPNISIPTLLFLIKRSRVSYLYHLAKFVLKNSRFTYGSNLYVQRKGIAMGTNAAVSLANFYLLSLVDRELKTFVDISNYNRFLDDILFIWNGSPSSAKAFMNSINRGEYKELDVGLKFTIEAPGTHLDMLDIHIRKDKFGYLSYTTFQKPSNKYLYLPYSSHHTKFTLKGFVKAELGRYARTNSSQHGYNLIKIEFLKRLLKRGYPLQFLSKIFNAHKFIDKFNEIEKEDTKLSIFKVRYTDRRLNGFISKTFLKLNHHNPATKMMIAWKKSKNLNSHLAQQNLTELQRDLIYRPTKTIQKRQRSISPAIRKHQWYEEFKRNKNT